MSIRIVLVAPRHPGNIGSAARAMKVMGLEQLRLVAPQKYPSSSADALAAGADDVLAAATVYDDVRSAVADCGLVIGTTARNRELPWRVFEPRCVRRSRSSQRRARPASQILFGAERTGPRTTRSSNVSGSSRSLPRRYGSLNLAMAVQIVAYELWLARRAAAPLNSPSTPLASATEMERFVSTSRVLEDIDFRDRTGEVTCLRGCAACSTAPCSTRTRSTS
jgi:TrmH family RNA methyltransferase